MHNITNQKNTAQETILKWTHLCTHYSQEIEYNSTQKVFLYPSLYTIPLSLEESTKS